MLTHCSQTKNAKEISSNWREQMVSWRWKDIFCFVPLVSHSPWKAPGHSGKLTINFFRPLNITLGNSSKKVETTAIQEAYNNSAGFFHDIKKTWQILCPIPLRRITSVVFDLLTLKTRPQELLMSDSEHFREALRTNIGDFTFQEAFDRTGRILNITGTCIVDLSWKY